jgi:hypothetical protein
MFSITFLVREPEVQVDFLVEELRQQMPSNPDNPLVISKGPAIPGWAISIQSPTPFTLAQRRFLISCGLPVFIKYRP